MSPQRSNRQALIEGALSCLEENSSDQITARGIVAASGANLGSIKYHFGSTDALIGHAMAEGFRRWLHEWATEMGDVSKLGSLERIERASDLVAQSVKRHTGLVNAFLAAIARAPHDRELRAALSESYRESRLQVASLLGLGEDRDADSAAKLLLATFDGLLIQAVLDPSSAIQSGELLKGVSRLFASAVS